MELKKMLREETRLHYQALMTANAILPAPTSPPNHQDLILDSSKMPLYLKNGDVSLHRGANIIARVRTCSYVDEVWMAKRGMVVLKAQSVMTEVRQFYRYIFTETIWSPA